jgi:hypothetical protein
MSLSHFAGSREVEKKARVIRLTNQYLALCVCQLIESIAVSLHELDAEYRATVASQMLTSRPLSSAEDHRHCHLQRTDTRITVICRGQATSLLSSAEDRQLHYCHLQRTDTFISVICRGQATSLLSFSEEHFITVICR